MWGCFPARVATADRLLLQHPLDEPVQPFVLLGGELAVGVAVRKCCDSQREATIPDTFRFGCYWDMAGEWRSG